MSTSSGIRLAWAAWNSATYWQTLRLRYEVLRRPLGLRFSRRAMAEERCQHHLLARCGDSVVGCVVLVPAPGGLRLRQMAVRPEWRGRGIGRLLLGAAERWARRRNASFVSLHARHHALGFYLRSGYRPHAGPFLEVRLRHYLVTKIL